MVTKSLVPSLSDLDFSSIIFLSNHPLFFRFILLSNQNIILTEISTGFNTAYILIKCLHKSLILLQLDAATFITKD